jgi:CHAD domain-containing protein
MREVELKLAVQDSFVMPPLFAEQPEVATVEELPELDMSTTYYDTPDLRLARSGVTLRYRTGEGGAPRWTLKLPVDGGDLSVHDEQHFEGTPESIPDPAVDLVTAYARSAPLESMASVRTRRLRWLLRGPDSTELAEVVDDEVSVLDDQRVVGRFREVEVEGRELDRDGLRSIAELLQGAGARPAEPIPKSVRALGPKATAPADIPSEVPVSPTDPAGRVVQAALASGLRRLLAHDPGVRLGDDVEAVHQMRVATRRLRSDLRTFSSLIDEDWSEPLTAELKWLGDALGSVRDLDVQGEHLRAVASDLSTALKPMLNQLRDRHEAARSTLLNEMRSPRYKELLDRLIAAVGAPAFTPESQNPCSEMLRPLVAKAWRNVARYGRALGPEDSDGDYHRVRIRTKRARYAAEAVAVGLPADESAAALAFAKKCARIQDVLGEMQDASVAIQEVEALAADNPRSGRLNLALGRLAEREARRKERARSAFPDAWKNLDRKKNLKWLRT